MKRVICIGECMLELRSAPKGALARSYAGDVYNTAVYLKRVAPKARVQFATAVGDDTLSQSMRAAWRREGIEDALAFSVPGKTPGLYLIETDPAGERHFHYWRGESAAKGWLREVLIYGGGDLFDGADLVYFSGISLAILKPDERQAAKRFLETLRGRVGKIAFDPNYRPKLWEDAKTARRIFEGVIPFADIVLPSEEDLERLYGLSDPEAQMEVLTNRLNVTEAAITAGPGRCLLFDGAAQWVEGAKARKVIDTSGAGDSFNGAYLASRLLKKSPAQAARAGLAMAAKVVGARGAIIPAEKDVQC